MDFSTFPAQWEGVALILGGVAFLMAVQPFTQVIWGGPKLVIGFGVDDRDKWRYLQCEIRNMPIHKGILRLLRVRREEAQDVVAHFGIRDHETGKTMLLGMIPEIKTNAGVVAQRVSVPASIFPVTFLIAGVYKSMGKVVIHGTPPEAPLPPGRYMVEVTVSFNGRVVRDKKQFHVDNTYPFVGWD